MKARRNILLFAAALMGLVISSGSAIAAPTNATSIELTPALEPSAEPATSPATSDALAPVEATNFACLSQCVREFTQCLSSGDCTDEYCQQQYFECKSYC